MTRGATLTLVIYLFIFALHGARTHTGTTRPLPADQQPVNLPW